MATFSFDEAIKESPGNTFSFTEALHGRKVPLPKGVAPSTAGGGRGGQGGRSFADVDAENARITKLVRADSTGLDGASAASQEFEGAQTAASEYAPESRAGLDWDRSPTDGGRGNKRRKDLKEQSAEFDGNATVGKDLMAGYEDVKSMVAGGLALPNILAMRGRQNIIRGFNALDEGENNTFGQPLLQQYRQARDKGDAGKMADIRAEYDASIAPRNAASIAAVAAQQKEIEGYTAESDRLSGPMPKFLDIDSAGSAGTYAARTISRGLPMLATSMAGAALGPGALAVTAGSTALSDLNSQAMRSGAEALKPVRHGSADRIADAIASNDAERAARLEGSVGSTVAMAVPYAAGDRFLGPAAQVAERGLFGAAKQVGSQTTREALAAVPKVIAKGATGEALSEGLIQEGVAGIGREYAAGERTGSLTLDDLKQVVEAGAAGAVIGAPASSVPAAMDVRRAARKPSEERKEIEAKLDELVARHGASPLAEKAIDRIKKEAKSRPVDEVPGMFQRFVTSLKKQGVFGGNATAEEIAGLAIDQGPPVAGQAQANPSTPPADGDQAQAGQPITETVRTKVDDGAHQAASSPENALAEPSAAQAKAGNYKVGPVKLAGLNISIENPEGSKRRGVDADGNPWETTMQAHYGYVQGSQASDGDNVDVFIKPGTPEGHRGPVFVVDQIDPKTGKYDEAKAIIGAKDQADAEAIYRSNYAADWRGLGAITGMPMGAFKAWAASPEARKPLGDLDEQPVSNVDTDAAQVAAANFRGRADAGGGGGTVGLAANGGPQLGRPAKPLEDGGKPVVALANGNQPNAELTQQPGRAARDPDEAIARMRKQMDDDYASTKFAARAADSEMEVSEPGDVMSPKGKPWASRVSAKIALDALGSSDGLARVARVARGWVIKGAGETQAAPVEVAASPPIDAQQVQAAQPQRAASAVEASASKLPKAAPSSADPTVAPPKTPKPAKPIKPLVYATRKKAEEAKTKGNTQKVQKVKGGFIVRDKSGKEVDAALNASAPARKGVALDEAKDSLVQAIAKLGGISRTSGASDLGVHPDDFKRASGVFGRPLFPAQGGMDADRALEGLVQAGFFGPDATVSDLEEALGSEFGGDPHYSMRHDWGRDEPLEDFTATELAETEYEQATPDVKALTERLLAEAESLGVDNESIREDAAQQTEGETEDAYHAATQAALQRAVAQAQADAARSDARASQAGNENSGETSGDQSRAEESEGLTLASQTAADIKAKDEREQAALAAEQKVKGEERARLKKQDDARDNKARADSTVDDFELGQNAVAQMTGISDLFAPPTPKAQPKARADAAKSPSVAQQVELRKRESVLQSLLKCLG